MARIKKHFNFIVLFALIGVFAFIFTGLCFAKTDIGSNVIAPEPGSIALVLTGITGWMVTVARRRFRQFKRKFDIVASLLGIMVSVPVIALVGIIIKIASPGPVLYKQKRVGMCGGEFDIYKIRTMNLDAEKATGPVWAGENDPRLIAFGRIPLGKILRKLHIDELPQLVNVLKGQMSIVGPRPERPVFVNSLSKEIRDYKKRLEIKPGITGLAQVWHKYDETIQDVKKKVKYDLLYIKRMCFLTDLNILLRTLLVAATGKGAR